jgi:hypothetical protein
MVLPLCVLLAYVWHLHTPNPNVKVPVQIDRNRLLPHRYAGPCMTCHKIAEVGPIAMNRDNMHAFRLNATEQRLLLAGQRVEVPTPAQKFGIPAITPDDILPHPYVGVCSNCHIVLDVRPPEAFINRAMQRAHQPLTGLGLGADQIARGGHQEDFRRALYRAVWGFVGLALLGPACIYIGMRLLERMRPSVYAGKFKSEEWLAVHAWCAGLFSLVTILHWYYSDRGNNLLHIAFVVVVWMTTAGLVLRHGWAHGKSRPDAPLLRLQRWFFLILAGLVGVGHFLAEFR